MIIIIAVVAVRVVVVPPRLLLFPAHTDTFRTHTSAQILGRSQKEQRERTHTKGASKN